MTHPGNPSEQRIGDDERNQTITALGEHYSLGRIDLTEYEQRVTQATQAQTAHDLAPLFSDLPQPCPNFLLPLIPQPQGQPVMPFAAQPGPAAPMAPSMPVHPQPYSDKSKVAAGLLQIFLPFGVGRFYTGHTGIAVAQLILVICGLPLCGVGAIPGLLWCLIDGIVFLASDSTDAQGRRLKS